MITLGKGGVIYLKSEQPYISGGKRQMLFFILKLKIHKIILLYKILNTFKNNTNFALLTESI